MIEYERKALQGVPDYRAAELLPKRSEYCLLIPVINEGARILTELGRAQTAGVDTLCDIVICDGQHEAGHPAAVRRQHAVDQDRPRQAGGTAAHGHLLCPEPRLQGRADHRWQ